jgi:hypothetical protein
VTSATLKSRLKVFGVGVVLAMGLLVIVLSFVQVWLMTTTQDVDAFGLIDSDQRGWPSSDKRGAFIMLNEQHDPSYTGNLVALLATTEPGVVDEQAGAHFLPGDIKTILFQAAALSEPGEYRVYRIGIAPEFQDTMKVTPQPGGKVLLIEPEDGTWDPGAYMIDVPADGMFGGRTYYQFYVDAVE